MLRLRNTLAAALPLLFAACAAPSPASEGGMVIGTTVLGGELNVTSFMLKPGATAAFDRDLVVNSEGDILIFGTLVGQAGDPARLDPRGADVVLRSKTRIVIAGEVRGAPGRDGSLAPEALQVLGEDPRHTQLVESEASARLAQLLQTRPDAITEVRVLDGGRGGHVILEAPEIFIERVVGGAGGNAGPAAHGGDGGNLYQTCGFAFRDGSPGGIAGKAGQAGDGVAGFNEGRGGHGGSGGGGIFWPPPIGTR